MGDLYSIHPGIWRDGTDSSSVTRLTTLQTHPGDQNPKTSDLLKAQIASHPLYPSLLSAYIQCRKVGAPPEVATLLEEISREKHNAAGVSGELGADPELDEFMESYCRVLKKYKDELSKPLDEAATFLTEIETQLGDLCKTSHSSSSSTTAINSFSGKTLRPAVVWQWWNVVLHEQSNHAHANGLQAAGLSEFNDTACF